MYRRFRTYWGLLWAPVDFNEVFTIDLRSLAVVRILTALIVLGDLATRVPDIALFYGDGSVLPTSELYAFTGGAWAWSLHTLFGGQPAFVACVMVLQALFALALLVGLWSRVASIGTWVLLVSLHNANPLILLGGDFLLRQTVFAGMFIPWGEVFSVDRYRSRKPFARVAIRNVWSAVFLIQIAFMYYFASMYKNSIEWNIDGSAFYYILSIDQYVTPLGRMLLQVPDVLRFLTIGVTLFQHCVVFLLFLPFANRYIRTLIAATLMLMHLCFGIGTYLGIFSWISMTVLGAFIPGMVWDGLVAFLVGTKNTVADRVARCINLPTTTDVLFKKRSKVTGYYGSVVVSCIGVAYICILFLWQAAEFKPALKQHHAWDILSVPVRALRLDQHWNLFAPRPYTDDGWDIIAGNVADGRVVDLFLGGEPLSYEKPTHVYRIYGISHRRQYTLELRKPQNDRYRAYYARYLCTRWNAVHSGPDRLESLTHIFMLERTPPPGSPPIPVVPTPLITFSCSTV